MKPKTSHIKAKISLFLITSFFLISSCRTSETVFPSSKPQAEAFTKFLSISFRIDKDRIKYDVKSNSFLLPNSVNYSWAEVEQLYNKSNEYKLIYESNK
ncbi:hypothetical protein ACFFGT_14415 [Mucilaginibacter angelicae]|uniref:Lipoprotein n=1 Tax=Mucilaginibacter angelicae TaxID=869718 RepID=A0ABV6L7E8_9SPHI